MHFKYKQALLCALLSFYTLLSGCKAEPAPTSSDSTRSSTSSNLSSSSNSSSSSGGSSSSSSTGNPAGIIHKFYVGNISHGGLFTEAFNQYWNQIAPDIEGKWESVESLRDQYNWVQLDNAYNYAKQNGLVFLQYRLIWGNSHSAWVANIPATELALEIKEWIQEYCKRYPNTDVLEVVGEAVQGHLPSSQAKRAFGNNWIERAYQLARRHCPNSALIFSDYHVLRYQTDEFIALAKPLAKAGLIDGIGIEAHQIEDMAALDIQDALDRLWNELHVPIYITEYEVALLNDDKQLEVLKSQFPIFYQHPHVRGITLYGYVYGKTWVNGSWLFTAEGAPRPAMSWLMDYVKKNPK